jgi:hypothetical protein
LCPFYAAFLAPGGFPRDGGLAWRSVDGPPVALPDRAGQPHRQAGQQRGGAASHMTVLSEGRRIIAATMAAGGYVWQGGRGPAGKGAGYRLDARTRILSFSALPSCVQFVAKNRAFQPKPLIPLGVRRL